MTDKPKPITDPEPLDDYKMNALAYHMYREGIDFNEWLNDIVNDELQKRNIVYFKRPSQTPPLFGKEYNDRF